MTMPDQTLCEQLADWVEQLRYDDLPHEIVRLMRRCLLDYMGVTIAGAQARIPRTLQELLGSGVAAGEVSVLGTGMRFSPQDAAFANGAAAATLELDDGNALAAIHVGSTAITAALAIAEISHASDRDVIVAMAAAYEVASRLAVATRKAAERGFNGTPLISVFGVAVAAAKMLKCDARGIAHATGLAGSGTGGLFDYLGGWLDSWSVNVGRIARDGLACAQLAQLGLSGPVDVFEGPRGLAAGFTDGELDIASILSSLGQEWLALGTYVKPYPCCRRLHPIIDGLLRIRPQLASGAEAIDKIVVETSADSARLDDMTFATVSAAQMSIPFGAAATILFGAPRLIHFERDAREDARLRSVAEKVDIRASRDPEIVSRPCAARVTLTSGCQTFTAMVNEPLGNPDNPLDDRSLGDKFLDLAGPVIGEDAASRLARTVWSFGEDREAHAARILTSLAVPEVR